MLWVQVLVQLQVLIGQVAVQRAVRPPCGMASALPSSWHSVSLHRVILRAAFFISLLLVTPASNGSLAGAAPRERQGGRTPGRGAADRRKRGCGASLPVVRRDARTETGE